MWVLEAGERVGRVLLAPHLGAWDPIEGLLHLAEAVVDDGLVAVEGEAHHPAADLELARHLVDAGVRDRFLALVPRRARGQHRREGDRVPDLRHVLDRPVQHQRAQGLDESGQVVVAPDAEPERHVALRHRHQPHAHLRDDPEVRLHEERVERGSEASLVHVPGPVSGHRAHAGAEQLAARQHDLHPARGRHVGAGREVRRAVLERVADDAAPAEVGHRHHEAGPGRAERVVEVEPADARLDDGVRAVLVDLEHAVHPPQAHEHGPVEARRGSAVAVVHPRRVCPERDRVLVRDPHDRLDLLDRLRHQRRRGRVVVPRREREWVSERAELVLAGDHRVGAKRRAECVERLLGQVGGQRDCHRAPPSFSGVPRIGAARPSGQELVAERRRRGASSGRERAWPGCFISRNTVLTSGQRLERLRATADPGAPRATPGLVPASETVYRLRTRGGCLGERDVKAARVGVRRGCMRAACRWQSKKAAEAD